MTAFQSERLPAQTSLPLLPVPPPVLLPDSQGALERAEELNEEQEMGPFQQKRFFIWEPSWLEPPRCPLSQSCWRRGGVGVTHGDN